MDDLERSDLIDAEGTSNVDMLSEIPESPIQQIGLVPVPDNGDLGSKRLKMESYLGPGETDKELQSKEENISESGRDENELDKHSDNELVINEDENRSYGDNDNPKNNAEVKTDKNDYKQLESLLEERKSTAAKEESKMEVKKEEFERKNSNGFKTDRDNDKEEGELEEGELEEDEEEEETKEGKDDNDNIPEQTEIKEESKEPEQKPPKEEKKKNSNKDKTETKDKKEREEKKRKHRDEDEKRKKKKKHYASEDEENQNQKKFPPGREKSYDFDILLKQEMFLVNSNPEGAYSADASVNASSFSTEYSPYKDGGESFDSGSGEEWDDKPRRRTKRKRRSSRSPSRKNEAICMFYLQGSCKRGNDCPYSHEIAPTRKMELCKFYMMDCCAKKEKCLYMHKDFPCKFYHFGMKCKAGDQCKFSHDPLQEITRNILLKHIELAPKDILGDFPRVSKHSAQIIISITEAKRKGEEYEPENLDSLMILEGKGFKYLDRLLKNVRKKKDGDKKEKEREREKEEKEKSPKRSKCREEHRDSDKDKERDKEREREKDREKERERDRDKDRYRNRDNRERERMRERRRHRSKGEYPSHKHRGENDRTQQQEHQHQHYYQPHGRVEDSRDRDYGRSSDGPGSSHGNPNQSVDSKWYSSDEEGETYNTQGMRRNQNNSPSQIRRQRIEENIQGPPSLHAQYPIQPNLANIDVMYLKNVLSAVQNQSSQNQNFSPLNSRMNEERSNAFWEQNTNRYSSTDNPTTGGYMDISNDIKEVFYDEPKDMLKEDQFSSNLDSFLQRARSKSLSAQSNYKDDFRETDVSGRDFKFQDSFERGWSANSNVNRDRRDESYQSTSAMQECASGDSDKGFAIENRRYSKEANSYDSKRDLDCTNPFNGLPYNSKSGSDFSDRPNNEVGDTDLRIFTSNINRQTEKFFDRSENPTSSIYDFDCRLIDSLNSSIINEDKMSSLPFKVPVHSSAKEIDASYNVHKPIVYKLLRVDIPKPDFSKIKINQDDRKIMEDPRLRKMLRSSLESPASPRENFEASPDNIIRSPSTEFKESRDPRKIATSRDPRTEAKVVPRVDPRPDPRMASRADPRCGNTRMNSRIDSRDPRIDRLDIRDPILDSEKRDTDPRIANQMYPNGMMDGHSFQQFLNMNNSIMPDPRGKPGLLGPAPSPKGIPVGLSGSVNQAIGANTFLLQQSMSGPPGPFSMNNERSDMMPGPTFQQNHWGCSGGRMNLNDPRLNRDIDMGP